MVELLKRLNLELSGGFKLLLGLFSVFAVFALLSIVSVVYPFSPFEINKYEVVPTSVCAGEAVQVFIQRDLVSGPYVVTTYDVTAEWLYSDGQILPAGVAEDIPLQNTSESNSSFRSAVLRIAPELEGEARLSSDVTLRGRMFGIFPTSQKINLVSDGKVRIKDCGGN